MMLAGLAPSPGHSGLSLQIALIDPQRILWERPVAGNDRFSLIHRNSIYGALVWEKFQIDDQGIPWLREIKTESPAVLEYYGLEESQTGWIKHIRKIDSMTIRITTTGEFRLHFGWESFDLSRNVSDGTLIKISIQKIPEN